MEPVDTVIRSAESFYFDLKQDETGRYRSWEHCYYRFYHARGKTDADIDYLSLLLAFYLASWGMYRGSSFLLQKDYKVHIPVVQELLKKEYDPLAGIECAELKKESNQQLLKKLSDFLTKYYHKIREEVKEKEIKSEISDTLVTKILLGTMGCVPAYDTYFIIGVKNQKAATGGYSLRSILRLADFYETYAGKLEPVRNKMKICGLPYPQMKLLDMGFWKIGSNPDLNEKH